MDVKQSLAIDSVVDFVNSQAEAGLYGNIVEVGLRGRVLVSRADRSMKLFETRLPPAEEGTRSWALIVVYQHIGFEVN